MSILDLSHLSDFDSILIAQILTIYISDVNNDIEILNQSIEKNDLDSSSRLAHKIVGSSLTIGALKVANAASDIENSIKTNQLENLQELRSKVFENFKEVREYIYKNNYLN